MREKKGASLKEPVNKLAISSVNFPVKTDGRGYCHTDGRQGAAVEGGELGIRELEVRAQVRWEGRELAS